MDDKQERAFADGEKQAYTSILRECLRNLGVGNMRLSNEATDYPSWILWLLIAGIKTWKAHSLAQAILWYWNLEAIRDGWRQGRRF